MVVVDIVDIFDVQLRLDSEKYLLENFVLHSAVINDNGPDQEWVLFDILDRRLTCLFQSLSDGFCLFNIDVHSL